MERQKTERLLEEQAGEGQAPKRGLGTGGQKSSNDLMRRAVDGDKGGGNRGGGGFDGGGFDGGGFGRNSRNSNGETAGWNILRLRQIVAGAVSRPFALALELPTRLSAARRSSVDADADEGGEGRKSRRSFTEM